MQKLAATRLQLPGNTLSQFIAMAQRAQPRCCCSALPSSSIASASASTHWLDERRRPRHRPSHSVACVADAAAAQQPANIDTQAPESDAAPAKAKKPLVMPTPIPPTAQLADVEGLFANGALLIDKPLEWTSFDVCAKVRNTLYRFLGKLKVGHAGTLDPMATGLLIVCTGKGTKAIDNFVAMSKSYSGMIRLGEGTVTYDAEAEVSERLPWEHITDEDIRQAIQSSLSGDILQVPPMYSALKVKGQKLYNLARDGQTIEREARPITVSDFRITRDPSNPQDLHFFVDCSKGTYVRSLAYDLGRALGTVAHLTALRRESIGAYSVKDAWQLKQLLEALQAAKEAKTAQTSPPASSPMETAATS